MAEAWTVFRSTVIARYPYSECFGNAISDHFTDLRLYFKSVLLEQYHEIWLPSLLGFKHAAPRLGPPFLKR